MAIKTSALISRMKRSKAKSATARIVIESINDGTVTRTDGNDNITVEAFTPNGSARSRGKRSLLFISADGTEITLNGHNARTIYRVLANHYGPSVD
jgi:hypothetical protein